MKEHPIIFSTEMVRAILKGRKTQTRRILKAKPGHIYLTEGDPGCPYGKIGDRLWVRESFCKNGELTIYKTDLGAEMLERWKPSIHLKRKDARLFLEITNIRVERLQDISEEDCQAEGVKWQWNGECEECYQWSVSGDKKSDEWFDQAEDCYKNLWDSIHKKENKWEDNPWVWVIEFKRVTE
jgi:hypothetical protein